jgi:hypothetical protein
MEKALIIGPETPFNLDATLDCGQAFRWERAEGA